MDVNEHERLSKIELRHKLKYKNRACIDVLQGTRDDTRDDMKNAMSYSLYHIFIIDFFQTLTFILQKRSLNWQIAK